MIREMIEALPAPHGKSAGLACVLGFFFGGIGLAIYLRNVVDFVFPVGLAIVAALVLGDAGLLGGAILAALYGYFRVHLANVAAGV